MFDLSEARTWCEAKGLGWDEVEAKRAETLFLALGLTNEQANRLVTHHAWRVAWLFNPAAYSWRQRFGLALHFLFGRAPVPFRKEA